MPLEQITDPSEIASLDNSYKNLPIKAPEMIDTEPKTRFERAVAASPHLKQITDPEEIKQYEQWAAEKPTAFSEFVYGARTGSGFVENAGDALQNYMASSGEEKASYLNYLFDAINQGTINPDPSMVDNETGDSARALAAERDMNGAMVDKSISHVPDNQEGLAVMGGRLGAALVDPTSLIPLAPKALGGGYVAAFLTGAGVGGADSIMYDAAKKGDFSSVEAAKYAAFGGVLGAGLHALGTQFTKAISTAKELNEPITPLMLEDMRTRHYIGRDPIQGEVISRVPGPEGTVYGDGFSASPISGEGPQTFEGVGSRYPVRPEGSPTSIEGELMPRDTPPAKLTDPGDILEGEFRIIKEETDALRQNLGKMLGAGDYVGAARVINDTLKLGWEGAGSTEVKAANNERQLWQSVPEDEAAALRRVYGLPPKAQASEPIQNPSASANVEASVESVLDTDTTNMKKIDTLAKSKQGGFANTQLVSSAAGAGIGYLYTGDLNGALWGAAIGAGLPYGAGLFARRIGRGAKAALEDPALIAKADSDYEMAAVQGWNIRSPLHILRTKFGGLGRKFDQLLDEAQTRFERSAGEHLYKLDEYQAAKRKAGVPKNVIEKAEIDAMDYLRGVKPEAKLNQAAKTIAANMSKYFSDVLKRSFQAGVIDAKTYARLGHIAAKKGYFPRQYDMAFLSTNAGKAKWVETFTSKGWKPETIKRTITNLMGDTPQTSELIRELTNKAGDTKLVYVSKALAEKMLHNFRKTHKVSRSGHLENARKIHVEDESVLDPFLVKDPRAVMAMYVADAEKRIAYAKTFGANDQKALAGIKYIEDKYGRAAGKMTGELYFQRVGDSRSEMLQKAADLSDAQRELIGRVSAFQTLKLTLAPLANMTQATVNSMIAMAHLSGGFKTNLRVMGSMLTDLKNNPEKFAETAARSGAALETSLMQIIGEFSSIEHRIMGKEFTGKMSFLETFNNPTKFLTRNGFIAAETLQRTIGSNIGRSYAELLIDDLTKARLAGKGTAKIEAQMKELKLDPTKTEWTEGEVLDAALRWSDHVNFRNTPGTMPLGWAHPHATWFRKFKTYSFNQANFIMEHVVKPVWKAETLGKKVAGGITLAGAAAVIGIPVDALRNVLMGDDKDYTFTERLVRGLSTIGGFGLWYDIVRSHDIVSSIAGPVASDIATISRAGKKFLTDDEHSPVRLLSDLMFGTMNVPWEKKLKETVKEYY